MSLSKSTESNAQRGKRYSDEYAGLLREAKDLDTEIVRDSVRAVRVPYFDDRQLQVNWRRRKEIASRAEKLEQWLKDHGHPVSGYRVSGIPSDVSGAFTKERENKRHESRQDDAEKNAAQAEDKAKALAPALEKYREAYAMAREDQKELDARTPDLSRALKQRDERKYDSLLREINSEQRRINESIDGLREEQDRLQRAGATGLAEESAHLLTQYPPRRNNFPAKDRDTSAGARRGKFSGQRSSGEDSSETIEDLNNAQQHFVRDHTDAIQKIKDLIRKENRLHEQIPHARDPAEAEREYDDAVRQTDDMIEKWTTYRAQWIRNGVPTHLLPPVPRNPDRPEHKHEEDHGGHA